ncbi:MAG TPA: hypothetical protein PLM89_09495, partial [Anaerolineales bacterium]|nr:hypothetical protein [Anaerolineales bacterium]
MTMFLPRIRAIRYAHVVLLLLLIFGAALPVRAQTLPVWETAQQMRDFAFQAQNELYAAARADDPLAQRQTAADLLDKAAQAYAMELQPAFKRSVSEADAQIT